MACHFTVPESGGFKGWLGVAEEVSDISLACRQIGPIRFKGKFEQGEDMFRQRRSLFFKKMQIVRGCDAKRNVLVYMVYSDRLIEGSPKNSTSSVPIMPWGAGDRRGAEMRRIHSVRGADLGLLRGSARADPRFGPGLGVAVAHQLHEFLRRRLVAATAVAALLRHRGANPRPFFLQRRWFAGPQLGGAAGPCRTLDDRLAGSAGRGFLANIDVAIAHDKIPC